MPELRAPLEIFDIGAGEQVELIIVSFEKGEATINVRRENKTKVVVAMRVHLAPGSKIAGMPYWDITAKTLIATLEPLLSALPSTGKKFTITKHGVAPTARFQVEMK